MICNKICLMWDFWCTTTTIQHSLCEYLFAVYTQPWAEVIRFTCILSKECQWGEPQQKSCEKSKKQANLLHFTSFTGILGRKVARTSFFISQRTFFFDGRKRSTKARVKHLWKRVGQMFLVFQNDLALVELQLYVEFLMCCVHAHETTITCVQKHYLQLCKLYKK